MLNRLLIWPFNVVDVCALFGGFSFSLLCNPNLRTYYFKMGLTRAVPRLLRFVTFVHLPFSVRSLDLSCCFTGVHEGQFMFCYKDEVK